jgi:hypothetical protein
MTRSESTLANHPRKKEIDRKWLFEDHVGLFSVVASSVQEKSSW